MIFPRPLKKGDTVAIISPATIVKSEYVEGAARRLVDMGYRVKVMPHACGPHSGTYASSAADRLADLRAALDDDEMRVILCARGGYGCVQLLDGIDDSMLLRDPKWIVGFSDVSALHAMMNSAGIASVHAPMAKHLTLLPDDDPCTLSLLRAVGEDAEAAYTWRQTEYDIPGGCRGRIRGGNFAVLNGLAATRYDMFRITDGEDVILFFEDISEAIYAVNRMLWRLHLAGTLSKAKGLIFGQFTEYRPDKNHATMEEMIATSLREWGISCPVAFNAPIGHVDNNVAIVEGGMADLLIDNELTTLKIAKK